VRAALRYTRGKTNSGDNLYNITPLNARVAVDHVNDAWSSFVKHVEPLAFIVNIHLVLTRAHNR
jgi:hypothetical protein